MEFLPNSLSFRVVAMLDVTSDDAIPSDFTGRIRKTTDGVLEYVAWYTKGKLDDPDARTPAYVHYRGDGQTKHERHYRLGRLHDPSAEQPAVRGYFANGSVRYEERYRYGLRHDVGDTPAIVKWRLDGTVARELHYTDGERVGYRRPRAGVARSRR